MDKMLKLRSCPFCGCETIFVLYVDDDNERVFFECPECGIETRIYPNLKEGIKHWNRRCTG